MSPWRGSTLPGRVEGTACIIRALVLPTVWIYSYECMGWLLVGRRDRHLVGDFAVRLGRLIDNYASRKDAEVRASLAANPRIHVHFTPTSDCWLNLVEVGFSMIERQAIHRGSCTSVRDLTGKIHAFIKAGTAASGDGSAGDRRVVVGRSAFASNYVLAPEVAGFDICESLTSRRTGRGSSAPSTSRTRAGCHLSSRARSACPWPARSASSAACASIDGISPG